MYLTAGFPSRAASLAALRMVQEEGADFLEVGVAFSDPVADGPAIQRSSRIALEGGASVSETLRLIEEASVDIPVIVFSYLNPLLAYGLERFLKDAVGVGVSGLLITDLPAREDPAAEQAVEQSGLDLIRLVAPTTPQDRLQMVLADAAGFIYLIARLGVTGAETDVDPALIDLISRVRKATPLPVAVGFGFRYPEQVRQVAGVADGVVVGSALVKRLGEGLDSARELMRELRSSLRAEAVPAPSSERGL